MPKAILEFSLPDEQEEYDMHIAGPKYHSVLWELYTYLRSQWKYDAGDIDGEAAEKIWAFVAEELREEGLKV